MVQMLLLNKRERVGRENVNQFAQLLLAKFKGEELPEILDEDP